MKRISVIGFGKIGQAIAANSLQHGVAVTAVDINPEVERVFANGTFTTNEPGLQDLLASNHASGDLTITADFGKVAGSDAIIIAIPLIVDDEKILLHEPFAKCIQELAKFCSKNTLIVIETSVPVGYSRDTVQPLLDAMGKKHGVDYLLANSPERIKSGTMLEQLRLIPKVIGGLTDQATDRAMEVYEWFFPKQLLHRVASIEAAEMVKLAGMIYRDVNIALANQLAQFADASGIGYVDLIPLINTDREANLLQPGIGVGGHCTPVYPYFLIENFKSRGLDFELARTSRDINDGMAKYAVGRVKDLVKEKHALILGLSFRPNVKEDALSTAYILKEELEKEGFEVGLNDVEYKAEEIRDRGFNAVEDIYASNAEVVFLVTMHQEYYQIDFKRLAGSGVKYVVDGRNGMDKEKVEGAGILYIGIGR